MIGKYVPAPGICARCTKNTTPSNKLCGSCARLIGMVKGGKTHPPSENRARMTIAENRLRRLDARPALVPCPSCGVKVEPGALERHRARERH